jgi:putative tryptophan/tyrosine transport system substrate-binding protein
MANSIRRRDVVMLAGGAAALPLAGLLPARAQQRSAPVIGYLDAGSQSARAPLTAAFLRGLGDQGYIEGRNLEILYRWAESRYDRLPALAADLVRQRVAVIHAQATPSALAAKSATATIPIIFSLGSDPVSLGLVASLNRPGGNVTGVTFLAQELTAKRLELLHEFVPTATSIGFLANPSGPQTEAELHEAEIAARILGVRLTILNATTPGEIEAAFGILVGQGIAALLVGVDTLFVEQRDQLAELVARYPVPAIYAFRDFVDAGGLMSYGPSWHDAWRMAGTYVGRILNGDKPGDLPVVQQSTRIETVLNLKTAMALGIQFPPKILALADAVVE